MWIMQTDFCLNAEADQFHPYEIGHSTVQDACRMGEQHHAKNLVLYHTQDNLLPLRKNKYLLEGRQYYHGNLYVPDDLEIIPLLY